MAPNLTIYCLEQVTDYSDFERLCHDLMALEDYPAIEPLGGFSDKGRDAIHVSCSTNQVTIFAYSVREDWQAKLAEDAKKIQRNGHTCHELVFMTTKQPTATQRDSWIEKIEQTYGWQLKIFGLERLRLLLDTKYPELKKNHSAIFPPNFLITQEGLNKSLDREHVLISYTPQDFVLADWLTRKLTAEGYRIWNKHLSESLVDEFPDDINHAIRDRIFCMIALFSNTSLDDSDITMQRNIAVGMDTTHSKDFVIPLRLDDFPIQKLDSQTKALTFISFETNWAKGLSKLLTRLKKNNCPKPISYGRTLSVESFLGKDVVLDEAETLHSNCFAIKVIPKIIYRFESRTSFFEQELLSDISLKWPFRKERSSNRFLSFFHPSEETKSKLGIVFSEGKAWETNMKVYGVNSENLIAELIKKSLQAKCHEKGLKYCEESKLFYFPSDLLTKNKLSYVKLDGSKASPITVCNHRKYKLSSERYWYHLAPVFSVNLEHLHLYSPSVILTVRVQLSDMEGQPLQKSKISSRRKDLCKGWWNPEWSKRILAIAQFLANGDHIILGDEPEQQIIIQANPISFYSTVSINEDAIGNYKIAQEELLSLRDSDDDEHVNNDE